MASILDRLNEIEAQQAPAQPSILDRLNALETEQPQQRVIATTRDGGRIIDMGDGTQAYTSEGYSTTDPDKIAQLMEGAKPVDIVQSDFDQERIAASPVTARAASVAQGLPFVGSYVDEALAGPTGGRGENIRGLQDAMRRENPGEALGLNLAGGIAGAAPAVVMGAPSVVAAAPSTILGQATVGAGIGAVTGAAEGAIYGAGEQQGEGRLANATQGALIGAGAGLVLGAVTPYATRALSAGWDRISKSDVAVIADELGISRDAARQVRDSMQGISEADARRALERAGPDGMLADMGRGPKEALDFAAAGGPAAANIAEEAVTARTAEATRKMTNVFDNTLGKPSGEQELITAVRTGTAPARSTAYDAAYALPINYASDAGRNLESILPRIPASAWRQADELMKLDGKGSLQQLFRIADDGTVSVQSMPDVRQLDWITRGLNDVADIEDAKGALGGKTNLGRLTSNLSKEIRKNLRLAVPEYGTALDTAADAISQRKAIETGYDLLLPGTRRETVADALTGASDAEVAAAKQGVRAQIDDAMARVTRNMGQDDADVKAAIAQVRAFSSAGNKTKLRLLMGEDEANALIREIDDLSTAFELQAAVAKNSATARRRAISEGFKETAEGGALDALRAGEPIDFAKRLTMALTDGGPSATRIREMKLYEEVAQALTGVRGAKAEAARRRIQSAISGQPLSIGQARAITDAVVGTTAATAGQQAQQQLTRP